MFESMTPEKAGISSKNVLEFIEVLEKSCAGTHGILMMKGNQIFEEGYYAPFHQDYCHRMYSQTKSFVGIAIGLLAEEGKLNIEDRMIDYFPDKIDSPVHPWLQRQTIREMLMMTTVGEPAWWFGAGEPDRVHLYLNRDKVKRPSGTMWEYDSAGSQVLAALVERLSGKSLLTYLKENLFDTMGTFQTAEILKTPNGDSWGDSAMICTLRDMASFGRLLMQKGNWEGKQLINEEYVKQATAKQVDNSNGPWGSVYRKGYGYQIWLIENGFSFVGMGNQLTLCLPEKDLLFTIYSDDQGAEDRRAIIGRAFLSLIAEKISKDSLPEDQEAFDKLQEKNNNLRLFALSGEKHSSLETEIAGKTYYCEENPLGMKEFAFSFEKECGTFAYENEQGKKEIRFGLNKNEFGYFPQLGYSDEYGAVPTTNGFMYKDAVSACWTQPNRLNMYIQIIDRYFGNCVVTFSFREDDVYCTFQKTAEAFLNEYNGTFLAHKK